MEIPIGACVSKLGIGSTRDVERCRTELLAPFLAGFNNLRNRYDTLPHASVGKLHDCNHFSRPCWHRLGFRRLALYKAPNRKTRKSRGTYGEKRSSIKTL